MSQDQFNVMMSYISNDLVVTICQRNQMEPKDAIEMLYSSQLYALLEQEETKVWYYSTDMLYLLLMEEQKCGKITFPDV